MAKIVREEEKFHEAMPIAPARPAYTRAEPEVVVRRDRAIPAVYTIAGIVEGLLALRLVLRLFGASYGSLFASAIYNVTEPLVRPFYGLFPQAGAPLLAIRAGIDLTTVFAVLFYAVAAYVVAAIIRVVRGW